jgi:hypothetical protein
MLTPKQLGQLGEILSKETPQSNNAQGLSLRDYMAAAKEDRPFLASSTIRVSAHGKIEATPARAPEKGPSYPARLENRALVRILVRCAKAGLPVGFGSREWLTIALRASDFRKEAEAVWQKK